MIFTTGVLGPLAMALIQIPFFPNPLNIGVFGFCIGLSFAGFCNWVYSR